MTTLPGTAKQQILVLESYENLARNSETANFSTGRLWVDLQRWLLRCAPQCWLLAKAVHIQWKEVHVSIMGAHGCWQIWGVDRLQQREGPTSKRSDATLINVLAPITSTYACAMNAAHTAVQQHQGNSIALANTCRSDTSIAPINAHVLCNWSARACTMWTTFAVQTCTCKMPNIIQLQLILDLCFRSGNLQMAVRPWVVLPMELWQTQHPSTAQTSLVCAATAGTVQMCVRANKPYTVHSWSGWFPQEVKAWCGLPRALAARSVWAQPTRWAKFW